jgi:hypothetical protein
MPTKTTMANNATTNRLFLFLICVPLSFSLQDS